MLMGFCFLLAVLALLFMLVLVGDHLIGRALEWRDARRRNRLARKYGFVEWSGKRGRS